MKTLKALKAFIKPFEAPQRSVEIKFKLIFILIQLSEMHGAVRVKEYKHSWENAKLYISLFERLPFIYNLH